VNEALSRHHFTRGTRGSGERWGSSSSLLTIRLIPLLQVRFIEVCQETGPAVGEPQAVCSCFSNMGASLSPDLISTTTHRRAPRLSANAA
jgi:hypothetical protein